jgi:hypothetical protein
MPEALQAAGKTPLPRLPALAAALSPASFCALGTILNCFYEFMTQVPQYEATTGGCGNPDLKTMFYCHHG